MVENKNPIISQALHLAEDCNFEKGHTFEVRKIALLLFDELLLLHHMSPEERLLLEASCLLHDIGWLKGRKRHHKVAQDIIMKDRVVSVSFRQRKIVALVARYHRRSLPNNQHAYYADLALSDKQIVKKLAALLRVADGLNRSHHGFIEDIICTVTSSSILLDVQARAISELDVYTGGKKAALFESVFRKRLIIRWNI